ncbi:MAG TPA: hypothetical protein PLJ84_02245 [Bacteroidales bacterium]|nr:hypothetical protein [Bacteroidales bacterium]
MSWYLVLTFVSLAFCLAMCAYHAYRLIALGNPSDFSKPSGNVGAGIKYSYTGGMDPRKKESAFLHLPTYTAGILYHLGTFFSIVLFVCILFSLRLPSVVTMLLTAFLAVSSICGAGILIKRIVKNTLRKLSNPDDYISNLLVTSFQLITAVYLNFPTPVYYILVSALLLYLPAGKLKHVIYFFAARYHLGLFFGYRGVWPPKN